MSTKIIKALVDGVIQNIEVEDIVSPTPEPTVEDRVVEIEEELVATNGNFLVGSGTTDLNEMTPEEALSHINAASIMPITKAEYESMTDDDMNANHLYVLTDVESEEVVHVTEEEYAALGDSVLTDDVTYLVEGESGLDSSLMAYDNAESGLEATNVQDAIDEIAQGGFGGADTTASNITYDNAVSGISSTNVQAAIDEAVTEINNKQATITGGATTITSSNLTANRALISDADGKVTASPTITSTELGYLNGAIGNIQDQISTAGRKITSNQNKIESLESNLETTNTNVDTNTTDIANLENSIAHLGEFKNVTTVLSGVDLLDRNRPNGHYYISNGTNYPQYGDAFGFLTVNMESRDYGKVIWQSYSKDDFYINTCVNGAWGGWEKVINETDLNTALGKLYDNSIMTTSFDDAPMGWSIGTKDVPNNPFPSFHTGVLTLGEGNYSQQIAISWEKNAITRMAHRIKDSGEWTSWVNIATESDLTWNYLGHVKGQNPITLPSGWKELSIVVYGSRYSTVGFHIFKEWIVDGTNGCVFSNGVLYEARIEVSNTSVITTGFFDSDGTTSILGDNVGMSVYYR